VTWVLALINYHLDSIEFHCRRDRVKRRRAEAKKEPKDESVAASLSSAEQHKGSPDLAELSKGLPSGWQAYVDESTKQVYYGNSLTSETSWERPTK